jgi:CDP-glucose 4,6-dehydratase
MSISRDFWKNKRVLITGHTGFKGAWLSILLAGLGAEVTGFASDIPTSPSLYELANVKELLDDYRNDIRDLSKVKEVVEHCQPEIVFHLAAQSLVRPSYQNPVETFSTNVMGTANLLEALRLSDSARVCINVTTDKCYENKEWHWGYREQDSLGGHDPYSSSKACSEIVTAAYRKSFFFENNSMGLATARAGNVIGGGDWAQDRLIPDIFNGWLNHKRIIIRNPGSIRPWQHVLEALHGYLVLAERLYDDPQQFSEAWNFGPYDNDVQSVGWIANHIKDVLKDIEFEFGSGDQLHEASFLKLDCSQARAKLGWNPCHDLTSAIDLVAEWYQAFRLKEDMLKITQKQIKKYLELLKK